MLKFTKIEAGHYASTDGHYGVVSDGYGYIPKAEREGFGVCAGITGGEWAAVYDPAGNLRDAHNDGDNLDWFPTKREAVEYCNWHAARH